MAAGHQEAAGPYWVWDCQPPWGGGGPWLLRRPKERAGKPGNRGKDPPCPLQPSPPIWCTLLVQPPGNPLAKDKRGFQSPNPSVAEAGGLDLDLRGVADNRPTWVEGEAAVQGLGQWSSLLLSYRGRHDTLLTLLHSPVVQPGSFSPQRDMQVLCPQLPLRLLSDILVSLISQEAAEKVRGDR